MTIIDKIRIKDAIVDSAYDIASGMKWNYDCLIQQKADIQNEIDENFGEVNDDIVLRLAMVDARLDVYNKVFSLLEKL